MRKLMTNKLLLNSLFYQDITHILLLLSRKETANILFFSIFSVEKNIIN